jgi:hypothetical protein
MFVRKPVLDRHPVQNTLVAVALGIAIFMLTPQVSPVLSKTETLSFFRTNKAAPTTNDLSVAPLPADFKARRRPAPVRAKGILMTGYTAGGSRFSSLLRLIRDTELNTVVIDIKDERGEISWVPRSAQARMAAAGLPKIVDPAATIRRLHRAGVYVIGRIVSFKDPILAAARPDLALQDTQGGIWHDLKGNGWLDPYSTEAQDYVISLGVEAVELGFDEIQYDYIRFPSDGDMTRAYSRYKDDRPAYKVIENFVARAHDQIVPRGAYISADLFGLVALVSDDLGIGQKLELIARHVDYVSLMLYPSHFHKPEYGIADPEKEPYRIVQVSLRDAKRRIAGTGAQLRPWLQDFTLPGGVPYTPAEVYAQIKATEDEGVGQWLLWNARNRYTVDALRPAPGSKGPPPQADNTLVSR